MTENNGFKAHIVAGKGMTHVIMPDGGAIPIESMITALQFRAAVTNAIKEAPFVRWHEGELAWPHATEIAQVPDPKDMYEAGIHDACHAIRAVMVDESEFSSKLPHVNELLEGLRQVYQDAVSDKTGRFVDEARAALNEGTFRTDASTPWGSLLIDLAALGQRERLGEFGHHQEGEQDWLFEVNAIESEFMKLRMEFSVSKPNMHELKARIWKAMNCPHAVQMGNLIRQDSLLPIPKRAQVERFQRYSVNLGQWYTTLTEIMYEFGEMQFASMREDAEKLDMIVGNTQSILYSQRSLLSRVADRLRRIYEAG